MEMKILLTSYFFTITNQICLFGWLFPFCHIINCNLIKLQNYCIQNLKFDHVEVSRSVAEVLSVDYIHSDLFITRIPRGSL